MEQIFFGVKTVSFRQFLFTNFAKLLSVDLWSGILKLTPNVLETYSDFAEFIFCKQKLSKRSYFLKFTRGRWPLRIADTVAVGAGSICVLL